MNLPKIIFYSKRECGACKLVRERLQQFSIQYEEIFNHKEETPSLRYKSEKLLPPITTRKLRQFLEDCGFKI